MDKDAFVQKVKLLCFQKGIKPTNACKESGVGGSFINDIERGRSPSVTKVQMLASYLGVTTSELLGEDTSETSQGPAQPDLVIRYNKLSKSDQEEVLAIIEMKLARGKSSQ